MSVVRRKMRSCSAFNFATTVAAASMFLWSDAARGGRGFFTSISVAASTVPAGAERRLGKKRVCSPGGDDTQIMTGICCKKRREKRGALSSQAQNAEDTRPGAGGHEDITAATSSSSSGSAKNVSASAFDVGGAGASTTAQRQLHMDEVDGEVPEEPPARPSPWQTLTASVVPGPGGSDPAIDEFWKNVSAFTGQRTSTSGALLRGLLHFFLTNHGGYPSQPLYGGVRIEVVKVEMICHA